MRKGELCKRGLITAVALLLANCELVPSDTTLDVGESKSISFELQPQLEPFCAGEPSKCIVVRDLAKIGNYAMELWLVDANDEKLEQLTTLRDDGLGADTQALDGIFSGSHTFIENAEGTLRLKAFETTTPALASNNVTEIVVSSSVNLADVVAAGESVYVRECTQCHNADGSALIGPSLISNSFVNNETAVISIIINGQGAMTAQPEILDDDLASLVTYVRNSFGNASGEITTAAAVASVR